MREVQGKNFNSLKSVCLFATLPISTLLWDLSTKNLYYQHFYTQKSVQRNAMPIHMIYGSINRFAEVPFH